MGQGSSGILVAGEELRGGAAVAPRRPHLPTPVRLQLPRCLNPCCLVGGHCLVGRPWARGRWGLLATCAAEPAAGLESCRGTKAEAHGPRKVRLTLPFTQIQGLKGRAEWEVY